MWGFVSGFLKFNVMFPRFVRVVACIRSLGFDVAVLRRQNIRETREEKVAPEFCVWRLEH